MYQKALLLSVIGPYCLVISYINRIPCICTGFSHAAPRIISTSVTSLNESTVAVSLSWESVETYYGGYPSSLLRTLLKIFDSEGRTNITGSVAVLGKVGRWREMT